MAARKTILITAAGSGIGKDAAFALSRRGHAVIATTHDEQAAARVAREAAEAGLAIRTFKLDITDPADRALIAEHDLDVLINNAAVGETGSLAEVPLDRMRGNFETNVFSTFALAQAALAGMLAKRRGTVVFVSSLAGRAPMPFLNPYSMTKHAVSAGAASLRAELHRIAPDVHAVLVEPGAYATGFNQKMIARKYEWMDERSPFWRIVPRLKREEARRFSLLEQKSTRSIVRQIVKAAESGRPKLRYVAPWWQGLGVRVQRILGR